MGVINHERQVIEDAPCLWMAFEDSLEQCALTSPDIDDLPKSREVIGLQDRQRTIIAHGRIEERRLIRVVLEIPEVGFAKDAIKGRLSRHDRLIQFTPR